MRSETQNMVEPDPRDPTSNSAENQLKSLFFWSGCTVMVSSMIGFGGMLMSGSFADALNLLYLFCFGFLSAILDSPYLDRNSMRLMHLEAMVGRYIGILLSVTGKGISFTFVGCALISIMFSNGSSPIVKVIEGVLNTYVIGVGLCTFYVGIVKSKRLSAARDAVLTSSPDRFVMEHIHKIIQPFAQEYPMHMGTQYGLTMTEFNTFLSSVGHFEPFSPYDLTLIYTALRRRRRKLGSQYKQAPVLNLSDIKIWLESRFVPL